MSSDARDRDATQRGGLVVSGATVRFGGVTALDDVSIEAAAGTVTGLVGPNGAGKTTLFNAITGSVPMSAGEIALGGRAIDQLPPYRRARLGVARTFQRIQLVDELTVRSNVLLGAHLRAGLMASAGLRKRRIQHDADERCADLLERSGLAADADVPASHLSTGQRRKVEVCRAMMLQPAVLLLDEPSAGMSADEADDVIGLVQQWAVEGGASCLLVEHDIDFIRRNVSYLYVIDFGKILAEGAVSDVLDNPTVHEAYLGTA